MYSNVDIHESSDLWYAGILFTLSVPTSYINPTLHIYFKNVKKLQIYSAGKIDRK